MAAVLAGLLLCASFSFCSTQYTLDDSKGLGKKFDGIGAISGGGATSRLLVDYSPNETSEMMDYLFKPHFGASLQILKVEIGGDSQSGEGTEMSHMRNASDEDYNRGYEWGIMVEAKKRNPDIKLYGLPWAFPGWLSMGKGQNPYAYPNVTARYIVNWVEGAKKTHNLTIDFIGIWNERPYDATYVKTLWKELDTRGFEETRIVVADGGWGIAADVLKDSELANAIDVIGAHYPGSKTTAQALETNKTLWASEDYSTYNDLTGGGCWARLINQNYVYGNMTSTIAWNLVAAYYKGPPFFRDGLMTAIHPWSGYYEVESPIWMTAHTTQFTSPGWSYLLHGSGVGELVGGGTYVTLKSSTTNDFTLVIETMTHDHSICIRPKLAPFTVKPQNASFQLKGSLAAKGVHLALYVTHLNFQGGPSTIFQRQADISVAADGQFTIELDVDSVYTLSTTRGQLKGHYPQDHPNVSFPFPYKDAFTYNSSREYPLYFEDQSGVFQLYDITGRAGKVLRQVITEPPIVWVPNANGPVTIIGDHTWVNLSVSVQVQTLSSNQSVFVAARVSSAGVSISKAQGVFFWLTGSGHYAVSSDINGKTVLAQGAAPVSVSPNKWITLSLQVKGASAWGCVNAVQAFALENFPVTSSGWAALGTGSYAYALFDDFSVDPPVSNSNDFCPVVSLP
ncbi:galactocerebrosidase-like [Oscarella lobularis]|uniref:galactocerebrosidase-like n=1 Tax=Oscarella lobularis TaxID=121494 RepID=UPI003313537E